MSDFACAICFGYLSDRFSLSAMRNSFTKSEGTKLHLTNKMLCVSHLLIPWLFAIVAQLLGGQFYQHLCVPASVSDAF